MILKLKPGQAERIHRLVRLRCANCDEDDNCLLLDDGEYHKCVQLICIHGICCKYFLNAVLPGEEKLYAQIIQQNEKEKKYENI